MAATRRMSGPRPTRLAFAQDCPPLAIIAAAKIAGVSLTTDPSLSPDSVPTLYLGSGIVLGGTLREHEARAAATARSQDEVAAAIDRLNGDISIWWML